MGLRQLVYNWLTKPTRKHYGEAIQAAVQPPLTVDTTDENAEYRFTIGKAINGNVITISRFKRNPHGPDWTHQLYVVPADTDLMEAVKTCITLQALSK